MTTTAPWLGINPAECLKDSDTRQRQLQTEELRHLRRTQTPKTGTPIGKIPTRIIKIDVINQRQLRHMHQLISLRPTPRQKSPLDTLRVPPSLLHVHTPNYSPTVRICQAIP